MFRRIVNALEVVALVAAAVFIVLLAYKPPAKHTKTPANADPLTIGARVFADNCTGCHGTKGEGITGPKLGGGAVREHVPTQELEVQIVSNGRGGMPSWQGRLTKTEIEDVVRYTREGL